MGLFEKGDGTLKDPKGTSPLGSFVQSDFLNIQIILFPLAVAHHSLRTALDSSASSRHRTGTQPVIGLWHDLDHGETGLGPLVDT